MEKIWKLIFEKQPTEDKKQPGMYSGDRCKFCGGFYEKARPYVCPSCFEAALELAKSEGWKPPSAQLIVAVDGTGLSDIESPSASDRAAT